MNYFPLSDKNPIDIPTVEKIKFPATVTKSSFLRGVASGNLGTHSIKVYTCDLESMVRDGPTRPIVTCVKGLLMNIDVNGTFLTLLL